MVWKKLAVVLFVVIVSVLIIGIPNSPQLVWQADIPVSPSVQIQCINPSLDSVSLIIESSTEIRELTIPTAGSATIFLSEFTENQQITTKLLQQDTSQITRCWKVDFGSESISSDVTPIEQNPDSDIILPINTYNNTNNTIEFTNPTGIENSSFLYPELSIYSSNGERISSPTLQNIEATSATKIDLSELVGPDFQGSLRLANTPNLSPIITRFSNNQPVASQLFGVVAATEEISTTTVPLTTATTTTMPPTVTNTPTVTATSTPTPTTFGCKTGEHSCSLGSSKWCCGNDKSCGISPGICQPQVCRTGEKQCTIANLNFCCNEQLSCPQTAAETIARCSQCAVSCSRRKDDGSESTWCCNDGETCDQSNGTCKYLNCPAQQVSCGGACCDVRDLDGIAGPDNQCVNAEINGSQVQTCNPGKGRCSTTGQGANLPTDTVFCKNYLGQELCCGPEDVCDEDPTVSKRCYPPGTFPCKSRPNPPHLIVIGVCPSGYICEPKLYPPAACLEPSKKYCGRDASSNPVVCNPTIETCIPGPPALCGSPP